MTSAYVEVILGVALGGIVGVVPTSIAAIAGVAMPTLSERRLTRGILTVGSLPIAGLTVLLIGGPAVELDSVWLLVVGGTVVVLITLFGFEQGTRVGSTLHRDGSKTVERGRPLADVAIDAIDASGQVTIRPQGSIRTVPGYPDLPAALRSEISVEKWQLPADLPLTELAGRIERQLLEEYGLDAVDVTVDPRGTATITAATQTSGIGRQVPDDHRAVSISTMVPDRIAPGERVTVKTGTDTLEGLVLSVGVEDSHTTKQRSPSVPDRQSVPVGRDETHRQSAERCREETDESANSRLTVAVPTDEAEQLLKAQQVIVAVRSQDIRPDFRALSLLGRAGNAVRITTIDEEILRVIEDSQKTPDIVVAHPPAGTADSEWMFDPSLDRLGPGWQVVLIGDDTSLGKLGRSVPVSTEVIGK